MATINRYTQQSLPRYNPTQLQEMLIAPQYMRQRHDEMANQTGEFSEMLDQFSNYHIHDDIAQEERDRLNTEIESFVDNLNRTGFNPQATQDFRRFRRDFSEALGPRGRLQRLQAANEAVSTGAEANMEEQLEAGWSPAVAKARIQNTINAYEEDFRNTGEIKNIQFESAPKKMDFQEDILELNKLLGSTTVKNSHSSILGGESAAGEMTLAQAGYTPYQDPTTGKIVLRNPSGHILKSDNYDQVANLMEYIRDKWTTPGGEGALSDAWEEYSPEQRLRDIESLGRTIESGTVENMLDVDRSYQNPFEPKGSGEDEKDYDPRVYVRNERTGNYGKDYRAAKNTANTVLDSDLTNNEEKNAAAETLLVLAEVDQAWLNSDEYKSLIPDTLKTTLSSLDSKIDIDNYLEFNSRDMGTGSRGGAVKGSVYEAEIGDDGNYYINKVTVTGGGINLQENRQRVESQPLTKEEADLFNSRHTQLRDIRKEENEFKNRLLETKGFETKSYIMSDIINDPNKTVARMNRMKDVIYSSNHHTVSKVEIISPSGDSEIVELSPTESIALLKQIGNSNWNPTEINLASQGSSLGVMSTFNVNSSRSNKISVANKTKLTDGENTVKFYSAIDASDGTPTDAVVERYPEQYREQVRRYLNTRDLPLVINSDQGEVLDRLQTHGAPSSAYVNRGMSLTPSWPESKVGLVADVVLNPYSDEDGKEYARVYTPTATDISEEAVVSAPLKWGSMFDGVSMVSLISEDANIRDVAFTEYVLTNIDSFRELSRYYKNGEYYKKMRGLDVNNPNHTEQYVNEIQNFVNDITTEYNTTDRGLLSDIKISDANLMDVLREVSSFRPYY